MSGIALVAHQRGIDVTGSDLKESRFSRALSKAGIGVVVGHSPDNIADDSIEVVVTSTAIPASNPELIAAREKGIEIWPRARMLAQLGLGRKTIAVAGTHGKTTTSSMLATTLDRLEQRPTFLIGGIVDGYDSNAQAGSGEYFVVEADESDGSFTYLDPSVALITNVERDHLDHYADIEEIHQAFFTFLSALSIDGAAVVCAESPGLYDLAVATDRRVITYGYSDDADVRCIPGERGVFSVRFSNGQTVDLRLDASPGWHNMLNGTGVLAVLYFLGYDICDCAEALAGFSGVRRRFDRIGEAGAVTVIDDYGHHPTEVKATLQAASELGYRRVHVLFQPHRYSRTQALASEFGTAFDKADTATFMDIYSAGETPIPGITGKTLVDAVRMHDPAADVCWISRRSELASFMASRADPGDLIITMGAGDVTAIGPQIIEALGQKDVP